MATAQENRVVWNHSYDWEKMGDEWSNAWGGPYMQWYGTILPRINAFVPANTILEIACGYGRWTRFLKDLCDNLVAVDLSATCIEVCKRRFRGSANITYIVNDGKTLEMIEDGQVDLLFTFDSLVHADESILDAYISQLPRILRDDGVAFIHHSNLGEYPHYSIFRKIPNIQRLVAKICFIEGNLHWRDFSVTAEKVSKWAENYGLRCISQEMINWGTRNILLDCFSVIVKEHSIWPRDARLLRNNHFMRETQHLSKLAKLYGDELIKLSRVR